MIVAGDHRFLSSRLSQVAEIIARRGWVCQRTNGRGVARCPSCSQNAHAQKVLVRCAQSRAASATPLRGDGGFEERDGMWVSVGLLCSRNAHDRNVLVGRAQSRINQGALENVWGIERTCVVEDRSAPIPGERTSKQRWPRLVGQPVLILKWRLACAAYAAVCRADRLS